MTERRLPIPERPWHLSKSGCWSLSLGARGLKVRVEPRKPGGTFQLGHRGACRRDAADWTWVGGWSRDHTGASPDDPRRDQAVTPDDLLGDERAAAGRCLAAREQPASRREVAEGGGPAPAGYDV